MAEDPTDVTLVSNDGIEFRLRLEVAQQQVDLLNACTGGETIPIPSADGETLGIAVEYLNAREEVQPGILMRVSDETNTLSTHTTFNLILVANYIGAAELLDGLCKSVAGLISGKTPEEIRETFNIPGPDDMFTAEEIALMKQENEWEDETHVSDEKMKRQRTEEWKSK